jgi:two-component system, OmpR family, sensor kinase
VLLTVIVALEVPLAVNLQRRALAELEAQALIRAQAVASAVRQEVRATRALRDVVREAADGGRVIAANDDGVLVADSAGIGLVGTDYATPERFEIQRALEGQVETRTGYSSTLGQDILATAVPVLRGGAPVGAVRVSLPMAEVSANVRRTLIGLIAVGGAVLVAGLLIAFFLAGSLSRPLRRVARTAERLGSGDLSARTGDVRAAREIEEVAREFDEMASRLEATVRAQGEFAGNASHQLRTPLTGLRLRLEAAAEDAPRTLRAELEAAIQEVDRLTAIVERLLLLARRREGAGGEAVPLRPAAERAVARWQARAEAAGATLDARGDGGEAFADPGDVDQILDNLIDNGISYAPGPIVVESGRADGRAFVAVEDRGPGIPEPERERVIERFYRGRGTASGGSGLGLSIVRELAERWNGAVEIRPGLVGGTRVEVRLPPAGP